LPRSQLPRDPYQVLGVASSASQAELKAAYRALVKQHHPDAGGDEYRILELNAAWEVLGDAERRAERARPRPRPPAATLSCWPGCSRCTPRSIGCSPR
jgi:molecular chaperone DnaJ